MGRELFFLIFVFSFCISGRRLLNILKLNSHYLDNIIFSFGLGFFIYSLIFFLLGISGLFSKYYFLLVQIILILFFSSPLLLFNDLKVLSLVSLKDFSLKVKIVVIIFILIEISLGLISFSPSFFWDELHYHLAAPETFLHFKKIIFLPYFPYANFPLAAEMLYAYFLSLNLEELCPQLHCLTSLFVLITIYKISRLFLNKENSLISLIIFLSIPLFLHLSTIAYIDLFVTFFGIIAIYSLLKYLESENFNYLFLCSLFCSAALSCKYAGVYFLFINILVIVYFIYKQRKTKLFYKKLNCFFKFILLTLFFSSPWYLKNWVLAANPVYPFFYNIFGGKYLTAEDSLRFTQDISSFGGMGKGFLALLKLPFNLTLQGKYFAGSLGPLFLGFLPSLIFFINFKPKPIFLKILFFNFIWLFFFWFYTTQQIRFMLPALAMLSIMYSYFIFQKNYFYTYLKNIFFVIIISTTIINFIFFFLTHINKTQFLFGKISKEKFISEYLESYDIFNFILPKLKTKEKIYLVNDNRIFYCQGHCIPSTSFNVIKWDKKYSPEERYKSLLKLKVKYLMFNLNLISYSPAEAKLIESDLKKGFLIPYCKKCDLILTMFKNKVFLYKININKL